MRTRWVWLISLFSLFIGSCSISQAGTEMPPPDPEIAPSENSPENPLELERTPESTKMASAPLVEKFVTLSKQDLASRLGIETGKITLMKADEKLWPNSALGCPRPGVFYPSGRVPGFQVWLEVEGTEYIYNTDFNGTVILCPELNPSVPNLPNDPTPGVPIR
jgi:hypothetical protein